MTPRDVLVEMRQLLTPEGSWTQGCMARDARGQLTSPGSPDAVCWCLEGAAMKVGRGLGGHWVAVKPVLYQATGSNYVEWNDQEGRTHQEVLDLLDRMIS